MKDTVIYAPNAVDAVMIFSGSIADGSLKAISLDILDWNVEPDRDENFCYLTLDGELRTGSYQDKNYSDITHYTTEVYVDSVEFAGSKE